MKTNQKQMELHKQGTWGKDFKKNRSLYLLFLPILVYFIIFNYVPMFGILAAFQDHNPIKGVFGSEWIGLQNFKDLFFSNSFGLVMRNTVMMALLNLTLGFAAPILLALLLSQIRYKRFKRITQLVSYLPNFVSAVVVCSLASAFLSYDGLLTNFLSKLGLKTELGWLNDNRVPVFWLINTFLGIWQGAGWGSIVYVAGISNINGNLYEAAAIDGANRWQVLWRITMPCLMPLIIMMFTMQIGMVFITAFDKVLLLYSPMIYDTADVLSTYTYRLAFTGVPNYGLSTASGLFQSLIGTFLLLFSNWLSKKTAKMSLF